MRPSLRQQALARIDAYMKNGGTVLFDTRDAVMAPPGPGGETRSPGMIALRGILSSLDIPELEPIPRDHVLTKTFYLLRDFPGRFNTGQFWVEAMAAARTKTARITRARRAAATACRRSSSPRTILPAPGRSVPTASRCCRLSPGEPRQRRVRIPRRRQHRDVHADRQLQGGSGSRPALLERLGQSERYVGLRRRILSTGSADRPVDGFRRGRCDCRAPARGTHTRRAAARTRADAGRARARKPVADARRPRAVDVRCSRCDRQITQPVVRQPRGPDRGRARGSYRSAGAHSGT